MGPREGSETLPSRRGVVRQSLFAVAQSDVHEDVSQGGFEADHERFGVFTALIALLRR
jgi:hypothetical protein